MMPYFIGSTVASESEKSGQTRETELSLIAEDRDLLGAIGKAAQNEYIIVNRLTLLRVGFLEYVNW